MKILLVDDHGLIRDALRALLEGLVADTSIVDALDGKQALEAIRLHGDLNLVLLDLNLPDMDGLELLAHMRRDHPLVSVAVLSARVEQDVVLRALDLGAAGFIPKTAHRDVLTNALRLVLAGGIYIPPEALSHGTSQMPLPGASPIDLGLTGRQLDVLALMMQGRSNKWICRALDLAEPTVKHHVTSILRALNVTNRTEAVVVVSALGWKLPKVK